MTKQIKPKKYAPVKVDGEVKSLPVPPLFSLWRHRNGNIYRVLAHANDTASVDRVGEYPFTIVYHNISNLELGPFFSRTLDRWNAGSFTEIVG